MAKFFQRRVRVLLFAGAAAFAVWKFGPASPQLQATDQVAFRVVSEAFANPPFFITGDGSHANPWELRTLSSGDVKSKVPLPTLVSIGDDPDGVFQSTPISPIDYAVIFRNLDRLGVKHVALGALLSWNDPDPIAKTALDRRLAGFDSMVTITPLTRGATSEAMPAAFIRSSIAVERVKGDVGVVPTVNRMPIPDTLLGNLKTFAGFSILEAESDAPGQPMLARWGDRIVFAFPLVAVLAERGLSPDGIEIKLGSHIKLGPQGPVIPITESGRLMGVRQRTGEEPVRAETLIRAESFAHQGSVFLRDDRTATEASDKAFTAGIASTISFIQAEGGLSSPRIFKRLPVKMEATLLGVLAALLVVLASASNFRLRIFYGVLAGVVLIGQFIGTAFFSCWLPGVFSLCVILAAFVAAWPFERRKTLAATVAPASPEPVAPVSPASTPTEIAPPIEVPAAPEPKLEPQPEPVVIPAKVPDKAPPKTLPAKKAAKKAAKKQPRKKK